METALNKPVPSWEPFQSDLWCSRKLNISRLFYITSPTADICNEFVHTNLRLHSIV